MRILVIMVALVAILGPQISTWKTTPLPTSASASSEEIRDLSTGATEIPVEATASPSPMPKIHKPRNSENPVADELCNLRLRDAIRIGLDNSEVIRVIRIGAIGDMGPATLDNVAGRFANTSRLTHPDADVVIAPLNRDASIWNFQAAAMALVRSVEQQYWALWQQQATLEAREAAVKQGEEILRRERAKLVFGRSSCADLAEAEQQLETFKLNLASATSDVITTERQLRNILGLPAADGFRIIAATPPVEARVEPDWESCVRQMGDSQPDVAQQKILIRLVELQLLLARNQLLPLMGLNELYQVNSLGGQLDQVGLVLSESIRRYAARPYPTSPDHKQPAQTDFDRRQVGMGFLMPLTFLGRGPLANTRQAQYQLLRQRMVLQQITHETTHSLARFFLEVDANYKQYATARRLNLAAKQRLEAQRALYEEGRITPDRLLDAIGQQADAIAKEALFLAVYNGSLASLEEAKGTLLDFDGIAIHEGPSPRKAYIQAKDQGVAPAAFEKPAELPTSLPVPPKPSDKTFPPRPKFNPAGLDCGPSFPDA